jgi:nucleosome assembly protein 1-like 1
MDTGKKLFGVTRIVTNGKSAPESPVRHATRIDPPTQRIGCCALMSRRRGGGNHQPHMEDDDDDDDDDEEIDVEEDDDAEEDEENPLEHLPDYVIERVEQLQTLHAARETFMEQYLKERATLEQKYEQLLQPIYQDRARIIRGALVAPPAPNETPEVKTEEPDVVLMDEKITPSMEQLDMQDDSAAPENTESMINDSSDATVMKERNGAASTVGEEEERVLGIPQFWASVMTRMETVGELLTVDDLDCLEHLMDVSCHEHEDGKGFTLTFTFKENDYFTNRTLTKTYIVPNLLISDEPILKEVKGEKIYWKKDKSLTHQTVQKKQRGKGRYAGQVRSVTKQEEKESFFHWFTTPKMPSSVEDMDEEEADQLEELFQSDFEIAQAFRCQVVPNAVLWFTGQVCVGDML